VKRESCEIRIVYESLNFLASHAANEATTRVIMIALSYTKQWILVKNVWRRNVNNEPDKTDRINKISLGELARRLAGLGHDTGYRGTSW